MTQNGLASLSPPRVAAVVNPSPGPPTSGAWLKGQQVIDTNGALWLCQSSGTPGTWVQLSVGGGNVDSFNGRVGAVTLQEEDVLATFSQKGGVMLGTGAGSGEELAVGANGSVLLADSTQPGGARWGNPALSYVAGTLSANYTVTGTLATFLTTAALAVGTWVVDIDALINLNAANTKVDITIAAGTATATFSGPVSSSFQNDISGTTSMSGNCHIRCVAVVTAAGTLVFQAAGATNAFILASSLNNSIAGATGYSAVKIA